MCARLEQTRRNFVIPRPSELTHYRATGSGDADDHAPHHPEEAALRGEELPATIWDYQTKQAVGRATQAHGPMSVIRTASLRQATPRKQERVAPGLPDRPAADDTARARPLLNELSKRRHRWKLSRPVVDWREHRMTLVSVTVVTAAGLGGAVVALLLR